MKCVFSPNPIVIRNVIPQQQHYLYNLPPHFIEDETGLRHFDRNQLETMSQGEIYNNSTKN